ncbi:hypothetical protein DFH09DRAFT_1305591 [Mycena vulgaris]|nr:hypothetical protein DFH09DRAFT_1305591 [Mycena vulgaris]
MTPEETKALRTIGLDLIQGFVAITNETLLLTIYGGLVVKAAFVLLDKRWRKRSSVLNMLAILIMFAISIILWTLDLANFIMEIKLIFVEDSGLSLDIRHSNAQAFIFRLLTAINALYSYMSLLGDAIIIYRVVVLASGTYYYRSWVLYVPVALLFGSLISTLMLTYCVAEVGSEIVLGTFQKPAFCRNVQTATYSMACATTTAATILIGLTIWNYRKSIKSMLGNNIVTSGTSGGSQTIPRRRSQVESILLLLLESGVLYFLFFAVQAVADIPRVHNWVRKQPGVSFAFVMYSYSSSVIVGIYPTLVIVLAHSHRGVLDAAAASTSVSASTLRVAPASGSSSTWPTLQFGSKRVQDEIELGIGRPSSHDLDREQERPAKPSGSFGT